MAKKQSGIHALDPERQAAMQELAALMPAFQQRRQDEADREARRRQFSPPGVLLTDAEQPFTAQRYFQNQDEDKRVAELQAQLNGKAFGERYAGEMPSESVQGLESWKTNPFVIGGPKFPTSTNNTPPPGMPTQEERMQIMRQRMPRSGGLPPSLASMGGGY